MKTSTYIKVHQDTLLEWTYDDDNILAEDYVIINDTLNNTTGFTFDSAVVNGNKSSQQLFQVDTVLNRFGIANPDTRPFIQFQKYAKPANATFDKLRVYFPLNYVFPNTLGFYLNIKAYDYDNSLYYDLCNMYIDITDSTHFSQIQLAETPINFQERLWGKYVELDVPSVYAQSRERDGSPSKPIAGTINYNLTGGLRGRGLSQTTPIFIDYRFILEKATVLSNPIYTLTTSNILSVPQTPAYKTLGVAIQHATDGDYFEVYGTFNGTSGEFSTFMELMENTGHRSYVIYSVTVYEENIPTDTIDFYVHDEFDRKIKFRPVLLFTSTTSSVSVTMKVVDTVDGSVTIRIAEYGMMATETAKYGKRMMQINVTNAQKPKIYNAKPDQIVLSEMGVNTLARRTAIQASTVQYKPLPIMVSSHNIVATDLTVKQNEDTFYGNDKLEMVLHPFDNLIKLRIAKEITQNSYKALELPSSDVKITLTFTSNSNKVEIPLYENTGEIDLTNGVFVFLIKSNDLSMIEKMKDTNRFYIVLHSNEFSTNVYSGTFIFSNSEEYKNRGKIQQAEVVDVTKKKTENNNNNKNAISPNAGQNVMGVPSQAFAQGAAITLADAHKLGFSPTQYTLIL